MVCVPEKGMLLLLFKYFLYYVYQYPPACMHAHYTLGALGGVMGIIALIITAVDSCAPPFGYCEWSPQAQALLNAETYLQSQNVILTKHA